MKWNALRKHSLHAKTAASVCLGHLKRNGTLCAERTHVKPGKSHWKGELCRKTDRSISSVLQTKHVMNAFHASGLYPVNSTVIISEMLKLSLTFADSTTPSEDASTVSDICKPFTEQQVKVQGDLDALTEGLSTPAKEWYSTRMKEGYDV